VTSADGQWKGTVVEVLPTGRGYEGTVRVQWEGYGLTYVTLSMLGYDNGRFVVRADGGQAQAAQSAGGGQEAQNAAGTNFAGDNDGTEIRSRLPVPQPANEGDDLTVLPNSSRPQRPEANAAYVQPARSNDDATRLSSPEPMPQASVRDLPQTPSYPTYPPPQPNPINATPYYAPRPDEQAEADDITRLPQPGVQVTPGPTTPQPLYPPLPQSAPVAPPIQPAHPASSYYPEAPPLPDTAQRRPAAEPMYVTEAEQTEVTVPVIEEQLSARSEWHDAGNITVRTQTEEVPQTFTQQVEREEAFVERIPVGRVLAEGETIEPRQEGDTYIMPVIIEEAVVITRRVLAEEVRITKRTVQTTQTVQATVRRQRAEVDTGSLGERVHDDRTSS